MSFEIKPATRQGVKPLIGFYSESGCGKTYSSLLLARGLLGPAGKIVMVDTESGRGSLYADVIPGGYSVIELRAPFSPARYIEAVNAAEQSSAGVIVIDSASHEWEGTGGVLDLAGEAEAKSGKPGLHNWRGPKMEHQKMMLRLLQSRTPIIVCLRAKHKTRQTKNAQGQTEIVKEDFTTPIQADDFIFEMTCHGEIMQDHTFRLTKCSHPALRECMPNNKMTAIKHGELLAAWCASPGTATKVPETKKALLVKLRDLTTDIHGWTKNLGVNGWKIAKPKLERWLTDELGIDTLLDTQTEEQLRHTIEQAERKLHEAVAP